MSSGVKYKWLSKRTPKIVHVPLLGQLTSNLMEHHIFSFKKWKSKTIDFNGVIDIYMCVILRTASPS